MSTRSFGSLSQSASLDGSYNCSDKPTTFLQLRLCANNLPRHGWRSAPNVSAVVKFLASPLSQSTRKVEWGKTEVIDQCCDPEWTKTLKIEYEFGTEVFFVVEITRHRVGKHREAEILGSAMFEIGDVLGSKNQTRVKMLPKNGCVFACLEPAEEKNENDFVFRFQFQTIELSSRSFLSFQPNTFVEIAKRKQRTSGNSWAAVYRSSPVFDSARPSWDIADLDLDAFNGDIECPIRISVWVHKKHTMLGFCETSCSKLLHAVVSKQETIQECEKDLILWNSTSKTREAGRIRVIRAELLTIGHILSKRSMKITSFPSRTVDDERTATTTNQSPGRMACPCAGAKTDMSFCEIDLCVAIDFTSSNGDPQVPGSHHYRMDVSWNDYEETIHTIGNAIASFNKSNRFPVWGFGAKYGGIVRHLFRCGAHDEVIGVEGILHAYRSVFATGLVMSGPTVFNQVIRKAAMRAQRYQDQNDPRYCVLLIVTSGNVVDTAETVKMLQIYNKLPFSVIIAGVGRTDYQEMRALINIPYIRHNTTFVSYRQHQHQPASLANAAMETLPQQVVDYFRRKFG